jgi:hypothetical protein
MSEVKVTCVSKGNCGYIYGVELPDGTKLCKTFMFVEVGVSESGWSDDRWAGRVGGSRTKTIKEPQTPEGALQDYLDNPNSKTWQPYRLEWSPGHRDYVVKLL